MRWHAATPICVAARANTPVAVKAGALVAAEPSSNIDALFALSSPDN